MTRCNQDENDDVFALTTCWRTLTTIWTLCRSRWIHHLRNPWCQLSHFTRARTWQRFFIIHNNDESVATMNNADDCLSYIEHHFPHKEVETYGITSGHIFESLQVLYWFLRYRRTPKASLATHFHKRWWMRTPWRARLNTESGCKSGIANASENTWQSHENFERCPPGVLKSLSEDSEQHSKEKKRILIDMFVYPHMHMDRMLNGTILNDRCLQTTYTKRMLNGWVMWPCCDPLASTSYHSKCNGPEKLMWSSRLAVSWIGHQKNSSSFRSSYYSTQSELNKNNIRRTSDTEMVNFSDILKNTILQQHSNKPPDNLSFPTLAGFLTSTFRAFFTRNSGGWRWLTLEGDLFARSTTWRKVEGSRASGRCF